MDFEAAQLSAPSSFVGASFTGRTNFTDAEFAGDQHFDEAQLSELDLDGAIFDPGSRLSLPQDAGGSVGIDKLRMDPGGVDHVVVSHADAQNGAVLLARQSALAQIETAARDGGDLHVAAEAGVERLTLARHEENWFWRSLNWLFYWGVAGYFLRPLHPATAIVALVLVAAIVRMRARSPSTNVRGGRVGRFLRELGTSVAAVWRGKSQGFWPGAEALVQKGLIAVLALSVANVWPPLAAVLKGVLP
jgi:hypothetical protein